MGYGNRRKVDERVVIGAAAPAAVLAMSLAFSAVAAWFQWINPHSFHELGRVVAMLFWATAAIGLLVAVFMFARLGIDGIRRPRRLALTSRDATQENALATAAPICPSCLVPLVKRELLSGADAGRLIWGCQNYPSCKEIVDAG